MPKLIVLLVAFCASIALANPDFYVHLENNSGRRVSLEVPNHPSVRRCYCLSKTQTNKIDGRYGGDVKLFSTSNCSGNYASGNRVTSNAQWVNSVSAGASGIPSVQFSTKCNWFA
ncbi:hypothetical protein EC968_005913 [Mortierella alpina]|nr:hypothetical protein EC968_005913 [Mortierella alpina]